MSTQTTNFKLTKPALSDPANITLLNNNWDILDSQGKALSDAVSDITTKLNGIANNAEVNQNAFTKVKVGSTTITADAKEDTLTLVAGSNVTLTPNTTNDSVTISATVEAGESYGEASTTTAGLMSAADKRKLDGLSNYSLPTASSSTLGGVKTTSTVSSTSGYTAAPIINGVPYYKDTTYSNASESTAGLMSASDKTKLNGLTNYSLPTASSTLGGVKTTSSVTSTSGHTACPIINGVPYYKNTTYSNATQSASGLMSSTDKKKLDGLIAYSYGTSDLTAGTSSLETGKLHFVYEA